MFYFYEYFVNRQLPSRYTDDDDDDAVIVLLLEQTFKWNAEKENKKHEHT